MDQVHLHLIITHLPIFGSILGALVLGYGIWSKSEHTKIAAYLLFVIAAIGTGIAYITGEEAEETVEKIPGIAENIIEQHAEFAEIALVGLIILGITSLIALLITYKKSAFSNTASVAMLFLSLISFILVARTGYLGGQIRHTETASGVIQNQGGQESGEKGDDD